MMAGKFDFATQWKFVVLYLSAASIASAVAVNFLLHSLRTDITVVREPYFVATLSMTTFFVVAFSIGFLGIGRPALPDAALLALRLSGSVLVVFAAILNIAGRVALGRYWSNQIEVVENHELIRVWPYNWCRHPLYGSLVIFGVGMGFALSNPVIVAATLLLFLPAVWQRAVREERALAGEFGEEYQRYCRDTAMILPRLSEPASKVARGLLGLLLLWGILGSHLDVFIVGALIALGLSFVMERDDFRFAWKVKPAVILCCVAIAHLAPNFSAVLWLPTAAALMSIFGHCPATLAMKLASRPEREAPA